METNQEAYNWLVKLGTRSDEESAYHLWSLCEDGSYHYGIMAANENERVFNIFPNIQELSMLLFTHACCYQFIYREKIIAGTVSSKGSGDERRRRILVEGLFLIL
jgi:hypothetical protein